MSTRASDPMCPATTERRAVQRCLAASTAFCGAKTRSGSPCGNLPMTNGRCYLHGGLSTGPRTADGIARQRAAVTLHGNRTASARQFRALLRQLRADARRTCEMV